MAVTWKVQQLASLAPLEQPADEPPTPLGGQKGTAGLFWALEPAVNRPSKSCRKAVAQGRRALALLCSADPPERFAWLDGGARVLLAPARRADLPPVQRVGGHNTIHYKFPPPSFRSNFFSADRLVFPRGSSY